MSLASLARDTALIHHGKNGAAESLRMFRIWSWSGGRDGLLCSACYISLPLCGKINQNQREEVEEEGSRRRMRGGEEEEVGGRGLLFSPPRQTQTPVINDRSSL